MIISDLFFTNENPNELIEKDFPSWEIHSFVVGHLFRKLSINNKHTRPKLAGTLGQIIMQRNSQAYPAAFGVPPPPPPIHVIWDRGAAAEETLVPVDPPHTYATPWRPAPVMPAFEVLSLPPPVLPPYVSAPVPVPAPAPSTAGSSAGGHPIGEQRFHPSHKRELEEWMKVMAGYFNGLIQFGSMAGSYVLYSSSANPHVNRAGQAILFFFGFRAGLYFLETAEDIATRVHKIPNPNMHREERKSAPSHLEHVKEDIHATAKGIPQVANLALTAMAGFESSYEFIRKDITPCIVAAGCVEFLILLEELYMYTSLLHSKSTMPKWLINFNSIVRGIIQIFSLTLTGSVGLQITTLVYRVISSLRLGLAFGRLLSFLTEIFLLVLCQIQKIRGQRALPVTAAVP